MGDFMRAAAEFSPPQNALFTGLLGLFLAVLPLAMQLSGHQSWVLSRCLYLLSAVLLWFTLIVGAWTFQGILPYAVRAQHVGWGATVLSGMWGLYILYTVLPHAVLRRSIARSLMRTAHLVNSGLQEESERSLYRGLTWDDRLKVWRRISTQHDEPPGPLCPRCAQDRQVLFPMTFKHDECGTPAFQRQWFTCQTCGYVSQNFNVHMDAMRSKLK